MKISALVLLLTTLNIAQAHAHVDDTYIINQRNFYNQRNDCVTEYVTLLSKQSRVSKACALKNPMRLAWTTQNYPNLRENPRRVQYWDGNYVREVTTDYRMLRELVDECRGRILSQNTLTDSGAEEQSFSMVNPNLDTSITESFMLVPMTSEEATQELNEAKIRCEQAEI